MANNTNKPKIKGGVSNYVAFTVALIAAFTLWIYAIGFDSTVFTRVIDGVEVTVTGEKELSEANGFTLREQLSFTMSVTISGKRSDISTVNGRDVHAVVDISGVAEAGDNTLPVKVTVPNGTTLVSQSEQEVNLFLDIYTTKSVPVEPNHTIASFGTGIRLGEETCNPSVITVKGPKSKLEQIDKAYARYSVFELKGNVTAYCAVELVDSEGNSVDNPYVSTDVQDIIVNLKVYKEKTIPVKVAFTGGLYGTSAATVLTSVSTIGVTGGLSEIDAIDALIIAIDETKFESVYETEVSVASLLPEGVTALESAPATITVSVSVPELEAKTLFLPADMITVSGSEGTLAATDGIYVKLFGFSDMLDEIHAADMTVTIDGEKLFTGENGKLCGYADIALPISTGVFVRGEYLVFVHEVSPQIQEESA